ncbi:hypothetical protein BGZ61DRAFT_369730, partial [Ilyonectria robusta]|uniref:uncharacterized protein n=1 Tax=Ilyonectria robusta TaxID=1079257 RepID=UPI001E8EF00E
FSEYGQACVDTGNCQDRAIEVKQASGLWLYTLATKAVIEVVSPVGVSATNAAANQNGFVSSTLAWLEDRKSHRRQFLRLGSLPERLPGSFRTDQALRSTW